MKRYPKVKVENRYQCRKKLEDTPVFLSLIIVKKEESDSNLTHSLHAWLEKADYTCLCSFRRVSLTTPLSFLSHLLPTHIGRQVENLPSSSFSFHSLSHMNRQETGCQNLGTFFVFVFLVYCLRILACVLIKILTCCVFDAPALIKCIFLDMPVR